MIEQVVGLDALSAQAKQDLNAWVAGSRQSGVLVGAIRSAAEGKLGALLLDGGVSYVLRFCAVQSPEAWNLKKIAQEFHSLRQPGPLVSFGQDRHTFWLKRKFYPKLAVPAVKSTNLRDFQQWSALWSELLQFLERMHARQLFHGHIAPCNLALEQAVPGLYRFELLDYGCLLNDSARLKAFLASNVTLDLAPEIAAKGGTASSATDVFGLGQLLTETLTVFEVKGAAVDARLFRLIERCCAQDPGARPKLREIVEFFLPPQKPSEQIAPRLLNPGSSELQSGKIIAAPTATALPISEAREVRQTEQPVLLRTRSIMAFRDWQVAILLVCTLGLLYLLLKPSLFRSADESFDVEAYWTSSQPSLMAKVAEQAVTDPESSAREVVVGDALKGNERPMARLALIRLAFNPLWEAELSEADRSVVLNLALASLREEATLNFTDFSILHPGVLYAIAASVSLDNPVKELETIKAANLANLPAPYGKAFELMSQGTQVNLSERSSLALAHLLAGEISEEILSGLFKGEERSSELQRRLGVLIFVLQNDAEKMNQAYLTLPKANQVIAKALAWFAGEPKAGWDKVDAGVKLSLLLGKVSDKLALEQYADLLKFPWPTIVKVAAQQLEGKLSANFKSIARLLGEGPNKFDRGQNLALIFAVNTQGELRDALISTWFTSHPDPATVLSLILGRADIHDSDTFNFEAARYLSEQGVNPALAQLRILSAHPEQMARALAVSRLDPRDQEQRKILEDMSILEPSKLLREQITGRLNSANKKKGP